MAERKFRTQFGPTPEPGKRYRHASDEERIAEILDLEIRLAKEGKPLNLRTARAAGIRGSDHKLHQLIREVLGKEDPDDPMDNVEVPVWPVKSPCAQSRKPKPEPKKQSDELTWTDKLKREYFAAWRRIRKIARKEEVEDVGAEPQAG